MNTHTPEIVTLCRENEDGEDQFAGWAMVFPTTEKVVAYLPGTGVDTGLLNAFSSIDSAALTLSYLDVYPATDWPELPSSPPAPH
ncbi:MAG: hypothetical protein ACRDQ4_25465 [Pseudonocardiaceae bacterium]